MAAGDNLLTRSVKCNWVSCGAKTRDPSLFCHNHRRASVVAAPNTQYRHSDTVVDRLRLPMVVRELATPGPTWSAAAAEHGAAVLGLYPEVLAEPTRLRIPDLFRAETGPLPWGDAERATLVYGERWSSTDADLERSGEDLYVTPREDQEFGEVLQRALLLRETVWVQRARQGGVVSGMGEAYDDRAEVLAQLSLQSLLGDDHARVTYSDASGRVGVRIAQDTLDGNVAHHYYVYGGRPAPTEDGRVYVQHQVAEDVYFTAPGAAQRVRLDGPVEPDVVEFLDGVCRALDLVNKYSVYHQSKLHLPVGWQDQAV